MPLSTDTARCIGYRPYSILATPCRTCLRQTETIHGPRQSWMRPPPVINNECVERIAPEGEKND